MQRIVLNALIRQVFELLLINKVYFQRIRQQTVPVCVFPEMKYHMEVIHRHGLKVYDVDPRAVFGYFTDIKDTRLVTDNLRHKYPLFYNLNSDPLLIPCLCQNHVQQREKLFLVAFFSKGLPENKKD